jgi:hypothetical protein
LNEQFYHQADAAHGDIALALAFAVGVKQSFTLAAK